jgi:hypothetical protein
MYPFIRRHDDCSKRQLSRVQGNLDELALLLKPTEEGAGRLGARCLYKVQPPLRVRNGSIQELQMRFAKPPGARRRSRLKVKLASSVSSSPAASHQDMRKIRE